MDYLSFNNAIKILAKNPVFTVSLMAYGSKFLSKPYINFHTLCMRESNGVTRLRGCAGSSEPLVLADSIVTKFSCADLTPTHRTAETNVSNFTCRRYMYC